MDLSLPATSGQGTHLNLEIGRLAQNTAITPIRAAQSGRGNTQAVTDQCFQPRLLLGGMQLLALE